MIKHYENGDTRQKYQGDMSILKIDKIDKDISFIPLKKNRLIVGHSESGHNHVLIKEKGADIEIAQDEKGYFIRVNSGSAKIVHEKVGGHETQTIEQGISFIGHQYEYSDLEDRIVID